MADSATLKQVAAACVLLDAPRANALERRLSLQLPPELSLVEGAFVLLGAEQTVTEVAGLPIEVDASFLVKQVRFDDVAMPPPPLPEDADAAAVAAWQAADDAARNVVGGMPIISPIPLGAGLSQALPEGTLMEGTRTQPGVPGLVGRAQGVVTPTVEKTVEVPAQVPVTLSLRIKFVVSTATGELDAAVTDGTGDPIANALWEGLDMAATAPIDIAFPLVFGKLPADLRPKLRDYRMRASVELAADGVSSGWVDLPEIKLELPVVPVPTILALFDGEFSGRALVVLPSPPLNALATATPTVSIGDALGLTRTVLSIVAAGHPLLAFLDWPAGKAVLSLAATADVKIASGPDVPWMWDYVYAPGVFGVFGRVTANDLMSSVVAIGAPGTKFQLWTSNETLGVTPLELTLGPELHAAIAKLADVRAAEGAAVTSGAGMSRVRGETDYDNSLSALRVVEVPDQ